MDVIGNSLNTDSQAFNLHGLTPGACVPVPHSGEKRQDDVLRNWRSDLESPLVSIICHTYNHAQFIGSALDGFLMQKTNFPFEIIVHDDASTDATREIIRNYQRQFPDIVKPIFQTVNQYSQGNRPIQFSLPTAQGEFVALCEGDDYWISPEKLQVQVDALRERPDAVVCFHNAIRVNEIGQFISMMDPCVTSEVSQTEMMRSPFIPTLTRLFRNHGFPWMELSNRPIANDICLTAYLGKFGGAIYLHDRVLSVYRHHDGGVWSKKTKYEKARITVDARLFIASQFHESPLASRAVDCHVATSIVQLLDLLGVVESLKIVFRYYLRKLFFGMKNGVVKRVSKSFKKSGR